MDCSLNWSYINYGELWCDPVIIALKAMNFKLELVLLRIMWVFGHFFTCRPTWSQSETFNLIGVNIIRLKSAKVNGDGKKHRSMPEVFLAASANTENSRRTQEKPLVPRVMAFGHWHELNIQLNLNRILCSHEFTVSMYLCWWIQPSPHSLPFTG